ncbi:MAG: hypothetical protein GXY86_16630 [Firmicutes bacterium]|nr:hypothetical protein [Bacillota bacterium]
MLSYKSTGIKKLIFDRICQIDEAIVEEDPEYKKLGERPSELLELIAAKLSPEDNKLLNEYDDKYFHQILRRDELYYSRGLMEGIILCYWVLTVGRGEKEIEV